jgi:hypothetical protein
MTIPFDLGLNPQGVNLPHHNKITRYKAKKKAAGYSPAAKVHSVTIII